jgi:hypothetical protein
LPPASRSEELEIHINLKRSIAMYGFHGLSAFSGELEPERGG